MERDLVIKRQAYRRLPSLASYVAVFRDYVRIEHDRRDPQGWLGEAALETLGDSLKILALDFEMPVAEIYRDVIEEGAG